MIMPTHPQPVSAGFFMPCANGYDHQLGRLAGAAYTSLRRLTAWDCRAAVVWLGAGRYRKQRPDFSCIGKSANSY